MGYIGAMENKMETTVVHWGYIGVIWGQWKMEIAYILGLYMYIIYDLGIKQARDWEVVECLLCQGSVSRQFFAASLLMTFWPSPHLAMIVWIEITDSNSINGRMKITAILVSSTMLIAPIASISFFIFYLILHSWGKIPQNPKSYIHHEEPTWSHHEAVGT